MQQVNQVSMMTAINVIIFTADDNSSSHADNRKKNILVPVEDLTFGANGSFDSAKKKFSINFRKANTKFSWVFIIILIIVICKWRRNL